MTGGALIRGDADRVFHGVAALDAAGPVEVSFLGNEKYHSRFLTTTAGAVIVPPGVDGGPDSTAVIAADNPSLAFAAVVAHFSTVSRAIQPGIHPRAVVDENATADPATVCIHAGAVIMAGASVGAGSEIGPNAVIGEDVIIGRDCRILANVTIRERCRIGDRVILQPGCVIGSDGYGYEFHDGRHVKIDQVGIVEIGDDVEIGANTTIDRARFGKTVIGEGTKIDNLVQIAHNVVIGSHCLVVSQTGIAGSARLGDRVTVAAQAGVGGHVTVGDDSILAGRCGVTTSVPGGQTYSGKPALPMREEMKLQAHVRRLPKLVERVRALEKSFGQGE